MTLDRVRAALYDHEANTRHRIEAWDRSVVAFFEHGGRTLVLVSTGDDGSSYVVETFDAHTAERIQSYLSLGVRGRSLRRFEHPRVPDPIQACMPR